MRLLKKFFFGFIGIMIVLSFNAMDFATGTSSGVQNNENIQVLQKKLQTMMFANLDRAKNYLPESAIEMLEKLSPPDEVSSKGVSMDSLEFLPEVMRKDIEQVRQKMRERHRVTNDLLDNSNQKK